MKVLFLSILLYVKIINCVIVTIPELGDILGTTTTSAWTNRNIYQFFSVKYALPPSGERRFLPPEPVGRWKNTFNATIPGIICPQISEISDLSNQVYNVDAEDCLSLNIYTPKVFNKKLSNFKFLPVMVYLHGGGFYESSSHRFPPNYLLEHDILLVIPQYRLGPLGFLSLHTDGIAGNVGLMDQVLALEWVNKYIKCFGGDNSQVTIFGQSSGANSISYHLISPMVKPHLFQKAILQSGTGYNSRSLNNNPIKIAKEIYQTMTDIEEDVDIYVMETMFKTVPVLDLINATLKWANINPLNIYNFGPTIQEAGNIKYLMKQPSDILESGDYRALPMITGITKDEGSFIVEYIYNILKALNLQNNDEFLRNDLTAFILRTVDIKNTFFKDIINNIYFKEIFQCNRNLTFKDVAPALIDILGSVTIKAGMLMQAKMNAKRINETYLYSFDYKGEHTRFGYDRNTSEYPWDGGVHHSDDLLYLFPYHYKLPLNAEDTKMSKIMTNMWANFAIFSKPMSKLLNAEWLPLMKDEDGPYLHINCSSYIAYNFAENEYKTTTNKYKKLLPVKQILNNCDHLRIDWITILFIIISAQITFLNRYLLCNKIK